MNRPTVQNKARRQAPTKSSLRLHRVPGWATALGIAGLNTLAVLGLSPQMPKVAPAIAIAALLLAGWRFEFMAEIGENRAIRVCATASHAFRITLGFLTLISTAFGIIAFADLGVKNMTMERLLMLPAALAVLVYGFAGHLRWTSTQEGTQAAGIATSQRGQLWKILAVGAAILTGTSVAWKQSAPNADLTGLSEKLKGIRLLTVDFVAREGRLPDARDSNAFTKRSLLDHISIVDNGIFRMELDVPRRRDAILYLIASNGAKNAADVQFRCIHDDEALLPTMQLEGTLQCERIAGLTIAALVTPGRPPSARIYFETGGAKRSHMRAEPETSPGPRTSHELAGAARDRISESLNGEPPVAVEIVAFTDSRGPQDLNLRLSEERSETVRELLKELGVPTTMISTRGGGIAPDGGRCQTQADATNCFARDRRVEIFYDYH